ncbi:MAG: type VI secretion system-associated FHA domain protein TagH [Novosphingobium sp.]
MPLTLTIRNVPALENGSPSSLVLDRRGARIGRIPTSDWCLPDPTRYISSSHCEVRFASDQYEMVDQSTNGTFLMGQDVRLPVPYVIRPGDVFIIGRFEIEASLDDASAAAAAERNAQPQIPEWSGWAAGTDGAEIAPSSSTSNWGAPPPSAAISGGGPMAQAWTPPAATPSPAPGGWDAPSAASAPPASAWDIAPPPVTPASDWSSPAAPQIAPGADDIWGKFSASNVVDWSRSGFNSPPPPQVIHQAAPLAPAVAVSAPASAPQPQLAPTLQVAAAAAPTTTPPTPPSPASVGMAHMLAAAQIDPAKITQDDAGTAALAGDLLRRLVAGLFVLLEARARAKSQMGAQGTNFSTDGNNPLKFARTPDQALVQLLNPPERGFQSADRAIEDSFKDLQAHQMATLRAMQGALRSTLERFSPSAIRARAKAQGIMAKILPSARDAALWKAYEKEFGGVVQGSDEAFMDMFAKEFRRAYEEIASKG